MFKSLYAKLATVLVILLVSLGIAYALFSIYAGQLFLQEVNQRFNRDLARQLLVQQDMVQGEELHAEEIKKLFSYYMHINPSIEIYLLDTQGNILAFEAPEMRIKREQVNLDPLKRFLSGDTAYPILGDDPRDENRKKIFSAAAYPFKGEPTQYLYVVLGGEDYDSAKALLQDSYYLQVSIIAVAATVAFGLLLGLFMFNLLTRRLFHLSHLMERFRDGGFHQHEPYSGTTQPQLQDEIDSLGETYNAMAERITEQMQALENKDSLRRNLIANVSHDLRTPLASLQGYIETLQMKTGEFTTEQRRHYLEIAHRQGERLTLLVEELFELSKLDANEAQPQLEPVMLSELVMDVIQKYRLQAEENRIQINSDFPAGISFVQADIAMLNRVLENLLGNAIDHTPEDGTIDLTLQAKAKGIEFTICNTGRGMQEDEIAHVFERFYQAPEKRRSRGAGLGLAIVKRILELHHSTITVDSSAEGPTCFRFTLTAER